MPSRVAAVSINPVHGFCKQPQPHVTLIPGEGIEGDAHRGRTTQHLYRMRQDPSQPNLCQVHLLAEEILDELRSKGFAVQPGELGENVLTSDIDLLRLPLGTRLHLGSEAIVEVTGLRTPCSKIDAFCQGLQQHMWGERDESGRKTRRAGIMSVVARGGIVKPGDTIRIHLPPLPYRSLPAV